MIIINLFFAEMEICLSLSLLVHYDYAFSTVGYIKVCMFVFCCVYVGVFMYLHEKIKK